MHSFSYGPLQTLLTTNQLHLHTALIATLALSPKKLTSSGIRVRGQLGVLTPGLTALVVRVYIGHEVTLTGRLSVGMQFHSRLYKHGAFSRLRCER